MGRWLDLWQPTVRTLNTFEDHMNRTAFTIATQQHHQFHSAIPGSAGVHFGEAGQTGGGVNLLFGRQAAIWDANMQKIFVFGPLLGCVGWARRRREREGLRAQRGGVLPLRG